MRRLAIIIGLLALMGQLASAQTEEAQFRAYWVDSFGPGLYTEAEIDRLIADTKAANMNAIVAQVTRRGDCLCNRAVMPRSEAEIDVYPFDPLQVLIDKAHAAGLQVHAWLNTSIMWAGDVLPRDPAHVFHAHGPWAQGRDNWVGLRNDGANRGGNLYYFDLGHPDAADYIVSMFLSIVQNYDVDGINFDYVRYPDYNPALNIPAWGYNPVAVTRFQAATGRSDVPEPTDPQWMQWRRDQVTSIVRRVYIETQAIKPHVRVSADTITYGLAPEGLDGWTQTRPYVEVLQDWRGWMEEGILDFNISMNYRREQSTAEPSPRQMFEAWGAFIKDHQYNRQAAIGTALYLNPIEDNVTQIRKAFLPSQAGNLAKGWVGFSYRTPDALVNDKRRLPEEGRAELSAALASIFTAPVPIPAMRWKIEPTTGHLSGTVKVVDGTAADQILVSLYDAATNAVLATRRTNGSGWFGFVDLSPGEYRVGVDAFGELDTASSVATVIAGQVARVWLLRSPLTAY